MRDDRFQTVSSFEMSIRIQHIEARCRLWPVCACLMWTIAAIFVAPTSLSGWEKIDSDKAPVQEAFPDWDAVIIKDQAIMEIDSDGETLFTHHRIMKIFSDPDKRYSHQEIPFNDNVRVVSIKARTIHPDGDEFFLEKDDIREKSLVSEFGLYSDARVKEYYLPRVTRDCVVEYEHQLRLSSLLYWSDWFFQSHLPILYSRYTLVIPRDFDFKVKVLNARMEPKIDFTRGKQTFLWERVNNRALAREVFMPPAADSAARLAFSPIRFTFDGRVYPSQSWDDIASWYWEISESSAAPTEKLSSLAADLSFGLDSRVGKIKAVFDYVQERVRYVSIAIGAGAFKPHFCTDVLEYGYGDCKDMSSLLIALLKAVGIQAFPALLSTKGHRSLLPEMPKVKQFDHVVVAIPEGGAYVWLDPACRNCRFGELPFEDQEASALVIGPERGELTLTTGSHENENSTRSLWEIKLNSDGSLSGSLSLKATGQEELAFRASLTELTPQRRRKALSGFLSSWFVDPYLVDSEFRNFEDSDSSVFIRASFVAGGFGIEDQSRLFLPVNLNTLSYLSVMFPQPQRELPVFFDYRFINEDEIKIQPPEEFQIEHLPGAVRLDEPFGLFESTYRVEENKIIRKRTFVRKELLIGASQYHRLKQFYDRAAEEDSKRLILSRKSDDK